MTSLANMSGYAVYSKVADNATKVFFGDVVGTAVIWWLAVAWRPGAVAGFTLFVLLTSLEALHVTAAVRTDRQIAPLALAGGVVTREDNQWFRRAAYVRVASVLISTALLVVIFHHLW